MRGRIRLQRLNDAWTLVMGGHFHDIAAGTATPKSYEFAWNDDVIAMNQFAGVLTNATEAVAAALEHRDQGRAGGGLQPAEHRARRRGGGQRQLSRAACRSAVHVTGPDGKEVPAQISGGKVIFRGQASRRWAMRFTMCSRCGCGRAALSFRFRMIRWRISIYRVQVECGRRRRQHLRQDDRQGIACRLRRAWRFPTTIPQQWPAWNMDWDQEQAAPKTYVSGPAQIRVVENGPVRVAVEVVARNRRLAVRPDHPPLGGRRGKARRVRKRDRLEHARVESEGDVPARPPRIDMATYNWDIGTIERPTAEPKKFEVPSHQWIDLTDMSGEFGATILTDCKNGSDKPNDNTIRLTLIRTPGTAGGYADQGTQDIGHHEFVYGIAGHCGGWRRRRDRLAGAASERSADRLRNFEACRRAGPRVFSAARSAIRASGFWR